jgi:hypothetical protein
MKKNCMVLGFFLALVSDFTVLFHPRCVTSICYSFVVVGKNGGAAEAKKIVTSMCGVHCLCPMISMSHILHAFICMILIIKMDVIIVPIT